MMKSPVSRRDFMQSGVLLAAACATAGTPPIVAQKLTARGKSFPVQLGVASYTFRNFDRARMIGFLKQLGIRDPT